MGKLRLLKTGFGDQCLAEWDVDRPDTVALAGAEFDRARRGALAFRLDGPGCQTAIGPDDPFDAAAPEILIVPAIRGGGPDLACPLEVDLGVGLEVLRSGRIHWREHAELPDDGGDYQAELVTSLGAILERTVVALAYFQARLAKLGHIAADIEANTIGSQIRASIAENLAPAPAGSPYGAGGPGSESPVSSRG